MKKVNPNRIKFYEFLNKEIKKEEFEEWVYSNKELEIEFQEDHYVDLISFPYKTGDVETYITKIVKTFFDVKEYELWRTTKLLEQISKSKIETVLATRKLRRLYKEQEETLGRSIITIRLGIGFESVMDECPIESEYSGWNQKALREKLETVEYYKEDLILSAAIELDELRSNDIKSIDMSFVSNNKHLHCLLAEKLQFPKFYRNNWDALWDAITGLVEMPNQLILYNWSEFQKNLPNEAKSLKEIIVDFNKESSEKNIVIKADNMR